MNENTTRVFTLAKLTAFLAVLALFAAPARAQSALGQLGNTLPAAADTLKPPPPAPPLPVISLPEKYAHLDPDHMVPGNLLADALKYYDANFKKIGNTRYLSVVDFSKHATARRFFIIDMQTGAVEAMRVAHGFGSDPDHDGWATEFGNKPGSSMSSLGVYRTAEVYTGEYGRSMRIDGLSPSNSNARKRSVVVHGYSCVPDTGNYVGFSEGCLAVSLANIDGVIEKLKGGSIIFAGLGEAR